MVKVIARWLVVDHTQYATSHRRENLIVIAGLRPFNPLMIHFLPATLHVQTTDGDSPATYSKSDPVSTVSSETSGCHLVVVAPWH
jgi:hypothetical protein